MFYASNTFEISLANGFDVYYDPDYFEEEMYMGHDVREEKAQFKAGLAVARKWLRRLLQVCHNAVGCLSLEIRINTDAGYENDYLYFKPGWDRLFKQMRRYYRDNFCHCDDGRCRGIGVEQSTSG